jgi:2'-5' RNA ligase
VTLFFSLWPDELARAGLADRAELIRRQHPTPGAWFEAARYHLTLHAVKAKPEHEAAWMDKTRTAAAQVRAAPFELRIDQAGSFPNQERIPWWLGCTQTPPGLTLLWRELRDVLKQHGVPVFSNPLTPHLTLVYNARRDLPERPVPPLTWAVRDFVLLRSRQGDPNERGSSLAYELLGRWPLNGGPDHAPQRDLWDN